MLSTAMELLILWSYPMTDGVNGIQNYGDQIEHKSEETHNQERNNEDQVCAESTFAFLF